MTQEFRSVGKMYDIKADKPTPLAVGVCQKRLNMDVDGNK